MAGYISLGIAFVLLLQSIGYGPIWAFLMSLFIYAGHIGFYNNRCITVYFWSGQFF